MKTKWRQMLLALFALMLLTAGLWTHTVYADIIYQLGDYVYSIADGKASIHSYIGSSSTVTLPTSVTIKKSTYAVTATDENSFADNAKLKSVTIPQGYVKLGNLSFKGCVNLSSVTIQADLENASESNAHDSEVSAPFYRTGTYTDGMTITFGPSVTRVPAYLFACSESKVTMNYTKIRKVVLPESVTSIGAFAFHHCYDLEEINLGEDLSLTKIEEHAFDSASLAEIILPKKMKNLGAGAFRDCGKLESVEIRGTIGNQQDLEAFYGAGKETNGMTVTFGADVTRVPSFLFNTFSEKSENVYPQVKKVVLSNKVAEIGEHAFCGCYDLEDVNFPEASRLHTIEYRAFADTALNSITFGPKVSSLGEQAFWHDTELTEVVLPEALTSLGRGVFRDCVNLCSVTIQGNIEDCEYTGTYNSETAAPFHNAGTGTDGIGMIVTFGSEVTRIPACLFATSGSKGDNIYPPIKKITLPVSITEVGQYAFYNCFDLEAATIRNANVGFGEKVFENADKLVVTCLAGGTTEQYMIENNIPVNYMKPKKASITDVINGSDYVTVKWEKAEGALKYKLYRKAGSGKWTELAETAKRTCKDKKVANGTTYQYRVYSVAGTKKGSASAAKKTVYLIPPKGLSAVNSGSQMAVITWTRNSKAGGYQIRYKTGRKSKIVDVKGKKTVKKTLKGLKKGSAYKIWIRARVTKASKTYYSAYSSAVKIRIKK